MPLLFPPPIDSVRVAVSGLVDVQRWVNIFWLQIVRGGAPARVDLDNLLDNFLAEYDTLASPHTGSLWSMHEGRAVWRTGVGTELTSVVPHVHVGGGGTNLPPSIAMLVNWQIEAAYRGGHPRTYLTGYGEGNLATPVKWADATTADVQGLATAFITGVNALGPFGTITSVSLGTVSFRSGNLPKPTPDFRAYHAGVPNPFVAHQRRRDSVGR